jgi:hypothetical protein
MFLPLHLYSLVNLDVLPGGPPLLEQDGVYVFYLYIFTLWSKLTNLDVLPGGPPLLEQDDLHVSIYIIILSG